jgi:GTPase SAR1 family protein
VTGPDNTGKTTLVNRLSKNLDIPVEPRYHTLPPKDGVDYFKWGMSVLEKGDKTNILLDRGIIDEFVYGPILRGGMVFDTYYKVKSLIDGLIESNVTIIFCQTPISVQLSNFDERSQLQGVKENIKLINKWFEYVLYSWPFMYLVKLRYDFTKPMAYENIIKEIK